MLCVPQEAERQLRVVDALAARSIAEAQAHGAEAEAARRECARLWALLLRHPEMMLLLQAAGFEETSSAESEAQEVQAALDAMLLRGA